MQLTQAYPSIGFARKAGIPKKVFSVKGRKGFLLFLKAKYPAAYEKLVRERPDLIEPSGLAGLATWATQVLDIIGKALPLYQQQQILRTQIKRAEKGLPPIPVEQIALPSVPIKVEMPEAVEKQVVGGLSAAKIAMFAGVAMLVFTMLTKRRR